MHANAEMDMVTMKEIVKYALEITFYIMDIVWLAHSIQFITQQQEYVHAKLAIKWSQGPVDLDVLQGKPLIQ